MNKNWVLGAIASALILTFFGCALEGKPDVPYIGTWIGRNLLTPGTPCAAILILNLDGTYESLLYPVGGSALQQMSSRGTYTCHDHVLDSEDTEIYNGTDWESCSINSETPYSIAGDELTLYSNFDYDGTPDWSWTAVRFLVNPAENWSLVGSWIKPTYEDPNDGIAVKVVYGDDGTAAVYEPIGSATYYEIDKLTYESVSSTPTSPVRCYRRVFGNAEKKGKPFDGLPLGGVLFGNSHYC